MTHDRQPMQTWLSIEENHAAMAKQCQLWVSVSALFCESYSLSIVKMPLNGVANPQILCNVLDVGKLQGFLEAPFFVDNVVRSGVFIRSVKNGSTKSVDVVIRDSFWVSQLPGNLDRNRDLKCQIEMIRKPSRLHQIHTG